MEAEDRKKITNTFFILTEHGGKSISMQEKLLRCGGSYSSLNKRGRGIYIYKKQQIAVQKRKLTGFEIASA